MSSCKCEAPTEYRATSEDTGGDCLYLRCAYCGGKVGMLGIDKKTLLKSITDPNEAGESVTIRFNPHDSPWMFKDGVLDE